MISPNPQARSSEPARRVLVVGGAGVFGARLVAGLLASTVFDVIVAGRSTKRLDALMARPGTPARLTPLVMDARTVTPAALAATGAFAVIDAAGPFQGGTFHLARAAIAAGLHSIDLADARDFVAGFSALDEAAKAAGVTALTGASSTPALSNAALDALTEGWARVVRVAIAISPGNRAPRGLSVIRAILSYAGRPVRVFTDGAWRERPGWGMLIRRPFPGLGRRFLSLAETPDLDIVPGRFAVEEEAVFRAGLELPLLHLGLSLASLPVRLGLLTSLAPFARPVRALAALFAGFGTDKGGMLVEAFGYDAAGRAVHGQWSLLAQAGDGPTVPTLPALASLRAIAEGRTAPGAMICAGVLPLAAIAAEFARLRITSQFHRGPAPPCLYRCVLGEAFNTLPAAIRRMHDPGWGLRAMGRARVDGPVGPLAALLAALFGFPAAEDDLALSLEIIAADGQETWTRSFGSTSFASVLSADRRPGRLIERFGAFRFVLDLPVDDTGVRGMPVRAWRLGPLPLPRFLAPRSCATEDVDEEGRFRFAVELALPWGLGRLVRYRGWLVPVGEMVGAAGFEPTTPSPPD